jgi:hypothetical protein
MGKWRSGPCAILGVIWDRMFIFTPRPLYSGVTVPGTHVTGGWVGPRAGLNWVAKRKNTCPCRESNPRHATRSSATGKEIHCFYRSHGLIIVFTKAPEPVESSPHQAPYFSSISIGQDLVCIPLFRPACYMFHPYSALCNVLPPR